jgi:L-arabinose isomerase
MNHSTPRIGLFAIGLDTYWDQFKSLKENLMNYHGTIGSELSKLNVECFDAGMVDNPEKAQLAGDYFHRENVDAIFLFISTYALSSTVLPVVQKAKVPVVILNLQPVAQIDYEAFNALGDRGKMTGVWLENCQACSVPEIASVFRRSHIPVHIVTGYLKQPEVWKDIKSWIDALHVVRVMSNNRLGVLGHYYGGMLDVYCDYTLQSTVFGTHIEILEMCELNELREKVTPSQIKAKISEFEEKFNISSECESSELERAAKTSVALDTLVANHRCGSLAYYYEGSKLYENIVTSIIAGNTLLTGRGIPVAGEHEILNVQAMKILDTLGAGGSFSEYYLMDFVDDVVYLGHDGPAHFAIAEGRVGLVPLPVYHGKPGKGLSIQMTVQHGPVTILSVVQTGEGKLELLFAEGETVPGPVLKIGNTNSRYKFPISATEYVNAWSKAGPSHHCAVGVGHHANTLIKIALILGLKYTKVC